MAYAKLSEGQGTVFTESQSDTLFHREAILRGQPPCSCIIISSSHPGDRSRAVALLLFPGDSLLRTVQGCVMTR